MTDSKREMSDPDTRTRKKRIPAPGVVTFSVEYDSPWQRLVAKGIMDFESVPSYNVFFKCVDDGSPPQV